MYGDINKLFQCFAELVFFYFIFAHNIYSKLQQYSSIYKHLQSRALQDISEFSQCKPKCLNTAQVVCPQHWSRKSPEYWWAMYLYRKGWAAYHIKVTPQCPLGRRGATVHNKLFSLFSRPARNCHHWATSLQAINTR